VALDGRGKQIMQRFQSDLLAFEQELQAQPSRYWRLRPGEIEASVSC
jgi:hypothetical protein